MCMANNHGDERRQAEPVALPPLPSRLYRFEYGAELGLLLLG